VLFPCQGGEYNGRVNTTRQQNLVDYTTGGGRIFATHYSYVWLHGNVQQNTVAPSATNTFDNTATWSNPVDATRPSPLTQTSYIDTSFPKGQLLSDWLGIVGASTTPGQISVDELRHNFESVIAPSQLWLTINDAALGTIPIHYTFNTPVGATADQQCGRVVFSDFHVENVNDGGTNTGLPEPTNFPDGCAPGGMTPQEKLLEFMIFDLGSCVTPDIPQCTKQSCTDQSIGCGPAGDGCGGQIDCGPCPTGQSCGGGGIPSQCGSPQCNGVSCQQQNIQCGPAGDGCGGLLDCGQCPTGQTCGGGGQPGVCGSGNCTPRDCASQNIACGPASNGCGAALDCGQCPAGQSCGGGGVPGQCGSLCTKLTCAGLGFDCGTAGDGCGATLDCGTCPSGKTCGGGGTPNVCGGGGPHG